MNKNLFSVKTFFVLAIALLCSMQIMAQKKYSEKELAAMKQKLYTSVASHAKDVQVMVDKVFSFGELGFQEFETSAYLTSVLEKNGFKLEGIKKKAVKKNGRYYDDLVYAKVK